MYTIIQKNILYSAKNETKAINMPGDEIMNKVY